MVEKAKTAFEKFRLLTKKIVGVPKAEADRRQQTQGADKKRRRSN